MNALETRSTDHAPLFAEARGDIQVSFEFFPPKTEKMAETLVGVDQDARAAAAALRLGHLRRRRLDPRAHPRDRRADPQGNLADAGRAPDLRRRERATRSTTSRANIGSSACATSSRCAATRPKPGTKYQPHPDGYRDAAELVAGLKTGRAVRHFGRRLSRNPSGFVDRGAFDLENLQAQGRRRGRPGDHPVLLLGRLLLPLPRRSRGGRDRRRDRARHPAGLQRRHDAALRRPLRRSHPDSGWTSCSKGSTTCPRRAS